MNSFVEANIPSNVLTAAAVPSGDSVRHDGEVAFFFGAGASIEADIPDTFEMIEHFKTNLEKEPQKQFLDELKKWGLQQKPKRLLDIELVLEALQNAVDWDKNPLSGLVYEKTGKMGFNRKELLKDLRDFIKKKVIAKSGKIQYLKSLKGFVEMYRPLNIFSANYDTVVELFCAEEKLKLRDGFDESWNPGVFNALDLDIRLFKLHGSITWYRSNQGRFLKIPVMLPESSIELLTGEIAEQLILYPAQKLEYVEPLFELLLESKRRLLDCKILIVVGYSFRDEHVRRLLWDTARQNPDFVVVLIDPRANEIYSKCLKTFDDGKTSSSLDGRVIQLPFYFGKVFSTLQEQLLPAITASRLLYRESELSENRGVAGNWRSVVLYASKCGDYELVARVVRARPQEFLTWLDCLHVFFLCLFSAAANKDPSHAESFLDLLKRKWEAIVDSLDCDPNSLKNQRLSITIKEADDRRYSPDDVLEALSKSKKIIEERIPWVDDTNSCIKPIQRLMSGLEGRCARWSELEKMSWPNLQKRFPNISSSDFNFKEISKEERRYMSMFKTFGVACRKRISDKVEV